MCHFTIPLVLEGREATSTCHCLDDNVIHLDCGVHKGSQAYHEHAHLDEFPTHEHVASYIWVPLHVYRRQL